MNDEASDEERAAKQNRHKLFILRIYEFLKWTSPVSRDRRWFLTSASDFGGFGQEGQRGSIPAKLAMKGLKLCSALLSFLVCRFYHFLYSYSATVVSFV